MLNKADTKILEAFEEAFGITPYQLMCQIYSGDILEIRVAFDRVLDADGHLTDIKSEGKIGYRKGSDKNLSSSTEPTPSVA